MSDLLDSQHNLHSKFATYNHNSSEQSGNFKSLPALSGFSVSTFDGMRDWRWFTEGLVTAKLKGWVNPEFSNAGESHTFWVAARCPLGNIVCVMAYRNLGMMAGRDFSQLVQSGRFWFPEGGFSGISLLTDDLPEGRLAYCGAGWTHPDFQKRGLAGALITIAHATALVRWQPDFFIGMFHQHVAERSVPKGAFGYAKVFPLINGAWIDDARMPHISRSVSIGVNSRTEMITLLQQRLKGMEP